MMYQRYELTENSRPFSSETYFFGYVWGSHYNYRRVYPVSGVDKRAYPIVLGPDEILEWRD